MDVMANRRRRCQEGAGKRARRLRSPALASEPPAAVETAMAVATARARLLGNSDRDGEADVERATKSVRRASDGRGTASKRAQATASN